MEKEDWVIIIGVLVLVITSIGVYISYKTYSSIELSEEIDFFTTETESVTGERVSWYSSLFGGDFAYGKEIIEEETYYEATIFMTNRGKRAHNVMLSFYCGKIDFYGIIKGSLSDFEIKHISESNTRLHFPIVDDINFQSWDVIFRINESVDEFSCRMEYVSDATEEIRKKIVINITRPSNS